MLLASAPASAVELERPLIEEHLESSAPAWAIALIEASTRIEDSVIGENPHRGFVETSVVFAGAHGIVLSPAHVTELGAFQARDAHGAELIAAMLTASIEFDAATRLFLAEPASVGFDQFHEARAELLGLASEVTPLLAPSPLGIQIVIPGLLALDTVGAPSHYDVDVVFLLDVGGDDVYRNNAGGSTVRSLGAATTCYHTEQASRVGVLVDVQGNDDYGAPTCGGNGGGVRGAGFLYDAAGDDHYNGTGRGTNGGAAEAGQGLLVDRSGNDTYASTSGGANGGGIGFLVGSEAPVAQGFLLDLGGNDTYTASSGGNGGGYYGGAGLLIDLLGNDTYLSAGSGTAGGGERGRGTLLDLAGDDTYRSSGSKSTQGGASTGGYMTCIGNLCPAPETVAAGLLLDAGGHDLYIEFYNSSLERHRWDDTIIPKGDAAGARIDLPGTGVPRNG